MNTIGKVKQKHVVLDAIVWPVCTCGQPQTVHPINDCPYIPSRPPESLGTIAIQSPDKILIGLWKLEQFFKKLRNLRLRKLQL